MINKIEECIELINDSRESHISWVKYFQEHPEEEYKEQWYIGDRIFHNECIKKYDYIINILNNLKNENSYSS